MSSGITEVVVILDRSGSMQTAREDHEGGLKSFVEDQKKLVGQVRFTLIKFDTKNSCDVPYDGVPISEVDAIELIPRGGTPLLDAIGLGVAHVRDRIGKLSDEEHPEHVICMIITDGQENSSREFSREQVRQLLSEREADGWSVLYLGANVDAFGEAGAMGFGANLSASFANSSKEVSSMYRSISSNTSGARMAVLRGAPEAEVFNSMNFSDDQRLGMSADASELKKYEDARRKQLKKGGDS